MIAGTLSVALPGCTILTVEDRSRLRAFIDFPYRLYRDSPHWVPPLRIAQKEILDTRKHPFYAHAVIRCFLAESGGQICGRIAAIIDHAYNEATGELVGAFGFYESIDSEPVTRCLIGAAVQWLREQGMAVLRGPMNPSINYECGVLVDGFESPPRVMMTYNPPYYDRLIQAAGLRQAKDLYAYRLADEICEKAWPRLTRGVRVLQTPGIQLRPVRLDRFEAELDTVAKVYASAWRENWGAAPMTIEEFRHLGKELKPLLIPKLALLAESENGPVGFGLVVPDINQALKHAKGSLFPFGLAKILLVKPRIKNLRVIAVGVTKEYRSAGVAAGLYASLIRNALDLGYREAECSWVLEDNITMNRSLQFIGAEIYKTYRLYEAPLSVWA